MPASTNKAGVPAGRNKSPGQVAYEAYIAAGHQDGGFTPDSGVRLPAWDEQEQRVRNRWECAALAVVDAHVMANPPAAEA
jgi:hypothetical protein